jgi:hypothetical protein
MNIITYKPNKSNEEILNYLREHSLSGAVRGNEHYFACPSPACAGVSKLNNFSVDGETGRFHCFRCNLSGIGLRGPRGLLSQCHLTLEPPEPKGKAFSFLPSAKTGLSDLAEKEKKKVESPTKGKAFSFFPSAKTGLRDLAKKEKKKVWISHEKLLELQKRRWDDEVVEYARRRCIPLFCLEDFNAFSLPAGTKPSFLQRPLPAATIFFPHLDAAGDVDHLVYRPVGEYANYLTPGPKPLYLSPERVSEWSEWLVVEEGIWDGLSVCWAGYRAIILLGSCFTQNHNLEVFRGRDVVFLLDSDNNNATEMANALKPLAKRVRIANIPDGDPNDLLMRYPADGVIHLRKIIEGAIEGRESYV